ncbi:hypothetical protein KAS50_04600, partial [bacterium]|nr:hypothetical protein [bacterium]
CSKKDSIEESSPGHTATIEAGDIKAVFIDNTAFGEHRAWYNGVAHLSHKKDTTNFFRPLYAGLNFEHIFDGQKWWREKEDFFEPRSSPMSIKRISESIVELHQPPSNLHKLESWTKFTVTEPHYIDMDFSCIPRADTFDRRYIGLFWASYINTYVDKGYYYIGITQGEEQKKWLEQLAPEHYVKSTVKYENDSREITFVDDYPPTLFNNYSDNAYSYPFYYGRREEMVFIIMFDQAGVIRFSHSPSGGGKIGPGRAPAWDFHYIIYDYKVNEKYGFKARVVYKPFISVDDVIDEYEDWAKIKIERPE